MASKKESASRLLVGDDRFDHEDLVEPLNEVLTLWSLWNKLAEAVGQQAKRRIWQSEADPRETRLKSLCKAAVEDGHQ